MKNLIKLLILFVSLTVITACNQQAPSSTIGIISLGKISDETGNAEKIKSELEKITHDKLLQGGVLVKMYFDVQNKEEQKLQPLLVDLINEHLLKEKGVVYCYGSIETPLKLDELYVTNAEVTILLENIFPLVNIAFNYTPIGIEILEPVVKV